jgi:hypothetical protein
MPVPEEPDISNVTLEIKPLKLLGNSTFEKYTSTIMPSLHKALNEISSYHTTLQQCFEHNLI